VADKGAMGKRAFGLQWCDEMNKTQPPGNRTMSGLFRNSPTSPT
jgi:hypothetical protein